jgi:hypothetical protein
VWQDLCAVLAHPENIVQALERAHGGHGLPQELHARTDALRQGHGRLTQQLERLTEAYWQGVIPWPEYQRRRQESAQKPQALATQEKPRAGQGERHHALAGRGQSRTALCQRVQTGFAHATFAQQRTLVALLIDRVLVAHGDVEIRYAIPTHPRGEISRLCQLRKDYFHDVLEILGRAEDDRGAVLRLLTLERRFVGRTPVPGALLRYAMAADRVLEHAEGRRRSALRGEPNVHRLALFLHGAIHRVPHALHLDI